MNLRPPLWLLVGSGLFVLTSVFVDPDTLNEVLSAALFIACGVGVLRWGPASWRVFWSTERPSMAAVGVMAMVLWLTGTMLGRIYTVLYLNLGRPVWMQVLHISPAITFIILCAVLLFIAVTRFDGEKPTRLGGVATGLFTLIGVLFSTAGPAIIAKMGTFLGALFARIM